MKEVTTTFDHWDTKPVVKKFSFKSDNYSMEEWCVRQSVERAGDDMWKESSQLDYGEFEGL